jgi:hypothetical protein
MLDYHEDSTVQILASISTTILGQFQIFCHTTTALRDIVDPISEM